MSNMIAQKYDPYYRPTINSLEEQKCQENYQMTLLEHTNKYRSLKSLKPLQGSKKLQYVALLTAQRFHVLNDIKKAVESLKLLNTGFAYGLYDYTSINECQNNAVNLASEWYELESWPPLDKEQNVNYMGCAVSIVNNLGCNVCYYQTEKGADKLKLNILPVELNIDLESYNDSFWTQFKGK
jgi:hypothetical protein